MKRLYSLGLLASVLLGSSLWIGCGSSNNVTPPAPQAAQFAFIRSSGSGGAAAALKTSRLLRITPRERLAMQKAAAKKMAATSATTVTYSLYTIKVDGTAETLVPNSAASSYYYLSVALSPDGKKIVFDSIGSATNYKNANIFLMNVDGTNPTALTSDAEGDSAEPRFTADGNSIFYVNYPANGSASQIWTYDLTTKEKEQIANAANLSFWSPNTNAAGTMGVAMAYDASTGHTNVYTVNVDTEAIQQVTTGDNPDFYWPTFSPDGQKIIVTSYSYDPDSDSDKEDLLSMNLDGTGLTSMTDVDNGTYAEDANLVGNQLVYQVWGTDRTSDLYVMNADGITVKQVTNNSVDDMVDFVRWYWSGS